jgi:hypothetical protein
MKTREIRRCTPATSPALQPSHFASHAADDALRAELILEAMQVLSKEFELCVMSVPPPNCAPDVPIDDLNELQSSLLSANFQASKSSARHEWNQLASEIPLVLDPRTTLGLFRKATGSAAEDLESMKKDRINGVERSHILEWAAAIAATQLKQKRRNALAIQVKHQIFLPPHKPARHIFSLLTLFSLSSAEMASSSKDLARRSQIHFFVMLQKNFPSVELARAPHIVAPICCAVLFQRFDSRFCNFFVADTGLWTINDEDVESLRGATDGHVNVHQPLAAQCGLFFQPYCASVPMPPEILGRYVTKSLPITNVLMPCAPQVQASGLYDG